MLPPDALETVRRGGYYTTVVRPGLRLIALNNNVCNVFNWWILYETKSIKSQFQWLHDVLLAAEKAGEKVHILAHIPNGDEDYHQPCAREYRNRCQIPQDHRRPLQRSLGVFQFQFVFRRKDFGSPGVGRLERRELGNVLRCQSQLHRLQC
jgi:hypothetical protein